MTRLQGLYRQRRPSDDGRRSKGRRRQRRKGGDGIKKKLKGVQKCKIKHFAFCYNNDYPLHKKAKYSVGYWLYELSLEQFKGILKDKKYLCDLGINLKNVSNF